jgi:hypothetical protein
MFCMLAGTVRNESVTLTPTQLFYFLTGTRWIRMIPRLHRMTVSFFRSEGGKIRLPAYGGYVCRTPEDADLQLLRTVPGRMDHGHQKAAL